MSYILKVSLRGLKGRSNLLFLIILWVILILPAKAQTPPLTGQQFYQQQIFLSKELRQAIDSGNQQKADQIRAQLKALFQQQSTQRKQLSDALSQAIKSGDQQNIQILKGELREQLIPQSERLNRKHRDPKETMLLQSLQAANKSGDKIKSDQIRGQLNQLHHQHFNQIKKLHDEIRLADKSNDKLREEYLKNQLMSMTP